MTTELVPAEPDAVAPVKKKRTLHRAYTKLPLELKLQAADMFMRKYTLDEIARELHISKSGAHKAIKEVRDQYNEKYPDMLDQLESYLTQTYLEGIGLTRGRLRSEIEQLPSDRAGYLMGQYVDGLSRLHALPKRSERKQVGLEQAAEDQRTGGRRVKMLVRRDFSELTPETQKLLLNRGIALNPVIDAEYEEASE